MLQDNVVWGTFHKDNCTEMVTFGKEHLCFWRLAWDASSVKFKMLRDEKSGPNAETVSHSNIAIDSTKQCVMLKRFETG